MDVFDLVAKLSFDKSEYEEGLSEASEEGSSFGDSLSSALGTAGKVAAGAIATVGTSAVALGKTFVDGISSVASYGDEIDKNSQKIGISAEAYQEWSFIAEHCGTSVDSLKGAMKTLVSSVDSGSESFEKIGLSMEDVQSMSQEELFSAVITQLQGMEEGTERTALAQDLLGKSAQELAPLLNTSADATEEMRQQVHELGGVLSDEAVSNSAAFEDSLTNLETSITGLKNGALAEFLPACTSIMDGLTSIFSGDSSGVEQVNEGVDNLIDTINENLPEIMDIGINLIENLAEGIIENLPELMDTAVDLVMEIADFIIENLPLLLDTAFQIIEEIANGLIENLPVLIPEIVDIMIEIVDTLIDNIDLLVDASISIITALAEGLINALPKLIDKLPTLIEKIVNAIVTNAPKLLQAGLQLILMLAQGLINNIPKLVAKIPQMITTIVNGFINLKDKMKDVGTKFIEGLWNGINDKVEWLKEKIAGFKDSVISAVKSFFGIQSPSKEFAKIGKFMAEGLGVGWDDSIEDVTDDIENSLNLDYSASASLPSTTTMAAGNIPIIIQSTIGLEPNSQGLFKIVKQQNDINTRATGYNALARA